MVSSGQFSDDDLLYMNNIGRKSFQWELWQCCNNLCSFCFIGENKNNTDKERMLKSLDDLKVALKNLDYSKYNNVSIIGGEFFQGQLNDADVNESFYDLVNTLASLYVNKKIGSIWVSATLTIGNQADLYKMLDMFEQGGVEPKPNYGCSGLWICTSWDAQGRFKTEDRKQNWEHHMRNLSLRYPWVKKNTTVILTQKFCETYLASEFKPSEFARQFETSLFFKPPALFRPHCYTTDENIEVGPEDDAATINQYLTSKKQEVEDYLGYKFCPDRRTFRKFLVKCAKENFEIYDKLFNVEYRADELHRNFNKAKSSTTVLRNKTSNMGSSSALEAVLNPNCQFHKHAASYGMYSDSNACMVCDRNQILQAVKGGNGKESYEYS